MAQFFYDPATKDTGTPSDWTVVLGSITFTIIDSDRGRVLELNFGTNGNDDVIVWDEIPTDEADWDCFAAFHVTFAEGAGRSTLEMHTRFQVSPLDSYLAEHLRSLSNEIIIAKYDDGAYTNLEFAPFTLDIGVTYYTRIRVVGTSMSLVVSTTRSDVQPVSAQDPTPQKSGGWDLTTTDSAITAAGGAAFGSFRDCTLEILEAGWGTDGDAAAFEDVAAPVMAYTTFTEYQVDDRPFDKWEFVLDNGGWSSGSSFEIKDIDGVRALRMVRLAGGSGNCMIRFLPSNLEWQESGFDLLTLVRLDHLGHSHAFAMGYGHFVPDSSSPNGRDHRSASLGETNRYQSFQHINGSGSILTIYDDHNVQDEDWVWLRVRVAPEGNVIESRWWFLNDPEPESWDASSTANDPVNDNVGFFLTSHMDSYITFFSVVAHGESHPEYDFSTDSVAEFDPANLQVIIDGTTAQLSWDASPTAGVQDYRIFRRSPQTGQPFDPEVDTPVATVDALTYDDEGLSEDDYDWQVFGRIPV